MKWFKFLIIILVATVFSGCDPLSKNSKSGLQVITDGVESSAFLDDQLIEKTPFINREIKPGEYTLKIQPDDPNLVTYETKISLKPGLLTVVTWKLAERPELSGGVIYEMEPISSKNKSEVSFVTIPDGAIISLEGKEKEFSPVIIQDIVPGHNEYEVSLPSYESQKHTINAVAGYRMLVSVKLAKVSIEEFQPTPNKTSDTKKEDDNKVLENSATQSAVINENIIIESTESSELNNAQASGKKVIIKSTNFFQDGQEVLRVRNASSSAGAEIGLAPVGSKYDYLGKTENNWFNINFNGKSGWVSATFAQFVL